MNDSHLINTLGGGVINDTTIKKMFTRFKIKSTRQRCEIARVILNKQQHLAADRIFSLVNQTTVKTSKATVYNTLNLFVKKGLIRQVIIDPTKIFYDSNVTPHYHFYNEDTGELIDFTAELSFESLPHLPKQTVQAGIDVIVRVKNAN